jgi:hypothetical protein
MFRVTLVALALVAVAAPSSNAQNAVLSEFYGRGVHAFYSGDYATATDFLTKAIDGGIKDPRAYYFRGLTSTASGDEYSAESDYRAGAEIEAAGSFASVGSSLTRIQGSCRMQIETIRQQARLDYQATSTARSKARYEGMEAASGDVLREPPVAKKPPMVPGAKRPSLPAVPPGAENPFANDTAAGEPKVDSKDALEGAMKDPFADDPASPAPGTPAPAANEDPFGGGAAPAAGSDPFGGAAAPAAPMAPAGEDPFGAAPAAGAADPFGN